MTTHRTVPAAVVRTESRRAKDTGCACRVICRETRHARELSGHRDYCESEMTSYDAWTDDEIVQRWNERAAILEFDGKKSRESAERLAAVQVKRTCGRLPQSVIDLIDKRD